jgi:hypothetical protein
MLDDVDELHGAFLQLDEVHVIPFAEHGREFSEIFGKPPHRQCCRVVGVDSEIQSDRVACHVICLRAEAENIARPAVCEGGMVKPWPPRLHGLTAAAPSSPWSCAIDQVASAPGPASDSAIGLVHATSSHAPGGDRREQIALRALHSRSAHAPRHSSSSSGGSGRASPWPPGSQRARRAPPGRTHCRRRPSVPSGVSGSRASRHEGVLADRRRRRPARPCTAGHLAHRLGREVGVRAVPRADGRSHWLLRQRRLLRRRRPCRSPWRPDALAHWHRISPTPPAAACTRIVSPAFTRIGAAQQVFARSCPSASSPRRSCPRSPAGSFTTCARPVIDAALRRRSPSGRRHRRRGRRTLHPATPWARPARPRRPPSMPRHRRPGRDRVEPGAVIGVDEVQPDGGVADQHLAGAGLRLPRSRPTPYSRPRRPRGCGSPCVVAILSLSPEISRDAVLKKAGGALVRQRRRHRVVMLAADPGEGMVAAGIAVQRHQRVVGRPSLILACASGGTNSSPSAICSMRGFLMLRASSRCSWI